jgi:large subunit ribosomal protein L23
MDLNIYQIILGPVISDKAYTLNKKLNKLVLRVHPHANKPMIAHALETLFNVKVDNVRIVIRKGKNKQFQRRAIVSPLVKKAIVTLAKGYSLDLLNQAGSDTSMAPGTNLQEKRA